MFGLLEEEKLVPQNPQLKQDLGNGQFENVTPGLMFERGASHGVAWADFDQDGDLDLALANNDPTAGTHYLYRNLLPASTASRSLQVVVVDKEGRWMRAGSEIRIWDSGSGRFLGTRIVDTGGGYSSQGARPVHFGLPPDVGLVDVETTILIHGVREVALLEDVDPAAYLGTHLEIRR